MIENPKVIGLLKEIGQKENIKEYLLVIYGQFNQEIVLSAIKLIERKLVLEKFPANIITKTKMICTEILQNINKHQELHGAILPYFIIGTNQKTINILSGNIVTEEAKLLIEAKLNEYITINKNVFRQYYKEMFKNSELSAAGNAGLGLLEIVYRANQNVKYNMENVSKGYFSFNLDVVINKPMLSA
jgi:hypothetical protein